MKKNRIYINKYSISFIFNLIMCFMFKTNSKRNLVNKKRKITIVILNLNLILFFIELHKYRII